MSNNNNNNIKIVTIGNGEVGKTTMLHCFTTNKFSEQYIPTAFDNYATNITVRNKVVSLQLWDTAGQSEYDQFRPLSYSNTDIFLVCFCVVDRGSFIDVKKKWVPEINKTMGKDRLYIIIGTKSDLRESTEQVDQVTPEEASKLCKEIGGIKYIECSSKSGLNIKDIFADAASEVLDYRSNKKLQQKKCVIQ